VNHIIYGKFNDGTPFKAVCTDLDGFINAAGTDHIITYTADDDALDRANIYAMENPVQIQRRNVRVLAIIPAEAEGCDDAIHRLLS
jgi:hypothetical protein